MKLLCLDGGTTNTRIRLTDGNRIIDSIKVNIGSSVKNNLKLRTAVKEMTDEILSRNSLKENDIAAIISAGMVTSELGLYELPHISAPAGAKEFADSVKKITLPDISSVPFWFIPGIKNNTYEPDMMRGEETECVGLLKGLGEIDSAAVILPGTHNKVIIVKDQKIVSVASMMSGELLSTLWKNTILSVSLPETLNIPIDTNEIIEGAKYCEKFGLTDAALRVRSIAKAGTKTKEQLGNYLIGTVLYCDIISINAKSKGLPLIIGGSNPLKAEMTALCREFSDNEILPVDDNISEMATALGQNYIFGLCN